MAGVGKSGQLHGLSNVLQNLNKEIAKIRLHTVEGLTEAALVVKYDSVKGTPIDLGNLRGSAYIMVTRQPADNPSPSFVGPDAGKASEDHARTLTQARGIANASKYTLTGIVGYSANYAFWVHEMPAHYNFNSGSNKFLQKALLKNQKRIQQIILKWAKIR